MGRKEELIALNTPIDGKRYTFTLDATVLKFAPDGWDGEEYQLTRDLSYFGVFRKFSVGELKFVKDGRDYLAAKYEADGVNSSVTLTVDETISTGSVRNRFVGYIDFSTYKVTELSVDVQLKDAELTDLVLIRKNTDVNLSALKSVDGETIPALTMTDITIPEINILEVGNWIESDTTTEFDTDHSLQLLISAAEFDEAKQTSGLLFGKFFENAIQDYLNTTFSVSIQANAYGVLGTAHFTISFHLDRWSGGVLSEADLWSDSFESTGTFPMVISIDDSTVIDIYTGDSLVLRCEIFNDISTGYIAYDYSHVKLSHQSESIPSKNVKGLQYHEAIERILQVLRGDSGLLYSTALGRIDIGYSADGFLGAIISGHYFRSNYNLKQGIVATLESAFKSLQAAYCLGMGVENDKFVIEDMAYFFKSDVILNIQNRIAPETIVKEYYPELAFNRISVGYNSYDYEMLGGIYEYNTTSKFSTILKPVDREQAIISPYRADMSGIIKLIKEPTENKDVQGESDNFLTVLNDSSEIKTSEGYEIADSSGNTDVLFNLDITPGRNIRRWGSFVRAALEKYTTSNIQFQTSDKNTKLRSKQIGEPEIIENADILVSTLSNPRWHAEIFIISVPWLETDIYVIQSNPYGLIRITDTEYGWILDYKNGNENRMSDWVLLRCNTDYVIPDGDPVYPADLTITKVITDRPTDGAKFLVNVVGDNGVEYTNLILVQGIGIVIQNIPYGTYTITETTIPDGYELDSITPLEVTIDVDNLHASVVVTNVYLGVPEVMKYGRLYNWYAAIDVRGIARSSWALPTQADYTTLQTYIGGSATGGIKLKEIGTTYWAAPNTGATNEYGFNGRGSGYRYSAGFTAFKETTVLGTITENGTKYVSFQLNYGLDTFVANTTTLKNIGTPLRCVRLATTSELLQADGTACNPYYDGEYYYRTVKIGTQVWTADNIKTRYYANSFKVEYGALYNVYAGLDSRKISSSDDWDIPTKTQLETMQSFLGGPSVAGGKMRDSNLNYWTDITGVTNSSKFNGRGAGYRGSSFLRINGDNHIMTRTLNYDTYYYIGILSSGSLAFSTTAYSYAYAGRSIRLIKATTSLTDGQTGTYTGNDGKVYRTICIGAQEWLADDLCETKYRNGDTIPIVTDQTTWSGLTTGAMCHYNNTESNSFINDNVIPVVTDNTEWAALTTGAMCSYNNDDSNL